MKICFKCKEEKPLSDYYKHKQMADGHLGKCKQCTKDDSTKHRGENLEKIRAYDRGRGNRQDKDYHVNYKARFPKKCKAQNTVGNAIREKKLFRKPCEVCGTSERIHAHHMDYDEPLNITWLCAAHHQQWHAKNGEGLNP